MKALRTVALVNLIALAGVVGPAVAQAPTVKIGYIPSDSFAVLYLLADRYLTPGGVNVQMVRLPGGAEITSQVATGQLQLGGAGMGAAGFNAAAAKLPIEFIAPLHMGFLEDYFTVRKAVWGTEVKRVDDLKGRVQGRTREHGRGRIGDGEALDQILDSRLHVIVVERLPVAPAPERLQ